MPLPQKHFYMIRHGETEANAARIMAGSLDSPLTHVGKEQARSVQHIVMAMEIKPSVIVHSNLSRARDTAAIINEVLSVPMYEEPDIAELHAGDWEGVPYDECAELLSGWPTPPNGESFDAFCTRIARGKKRVLDAYNGPVLIVSHGGVFRALGGLYGLQTPGVFRNCHMYEFMPAPERAFFPWDVYSYGFGATSEPTRSPEPVFYESPRLDETPAERIA